MIRARSHCFMMHHAAATGRTGICNNDDDLLYIALIYKCIGRNLRNGFAFCTTYIGTYMYKALTSVYDLWYMYRPASSDSILRGVIDISYSRYLIGYLNY